VGTITTGRPLDGGTPTDGPALRLDPDGPAAALFEASPHALASGPGLGMWSTLLDPWGAADVPEMLVWMGPDATPLPAHVHTAGTERFRPVEGELTVVEDGAERRLGPDESHTVGTGTEHYFRNDTDAVVAFRAEVPWRRTIETQYTTFGRDHEGAFGAASEYGEPGPMHGLVTAAYLREGTRITEGPPFLVQRVLWATVGRLARARGHRATEERFLQDAFWERTVEQPDL
jgi:mannose-6-phosphate isomerase-like protein (cupin superfamily)